MRGRRIVCFPDTTGCLLTTEKLVNVVLPENTEYDLLTLIGILNSHVPSFYVQKMLFSETTETSRVMDDDYVGEIPIPKNISKFAKYSVKCLVSYLLLLNSTEYLRETEKENIKFLDRLLDVLVYLLYFEKKFREEGLETNLFELLYKRLEDIDYSRFAKHIYKIYLSKSEKEEINKITRKYLSKILPVIETLKEDKTIKRIIETILSDRWVYTVEKVTTRD